MEEFERADSFRKNRIEALQPIHSALKLSLELTKSGMHTNSLRLQDGLICFARTALSGGLYGTWCG